MPLWIVNGDITHMDTDAVVNAANSHLKAGGGVCGAIFSAAGHELLARACDKIGSCPTGSAVITDGFGLAAKYIIHAVGPVWHGGGRGEEEALRGAYRSSLKLAEDHGMESIAFPLISSGIYGYPKDQAMQVAVNTIGEFLSGSDLSVYLVLFGQDKSVAEMKLSEFNAVASFFRVDESKLRVEEPGESFSSMLFRLIDARGMTDPEVYRRANLDRRHFSKIRSNEDYRPSKETVMALALALQLGVEEAETFLRCAGYAFSEYYYTDRLVAKAIRTGVYDIHTVNLELWNNGHKCLGARTDVV